VEQRAMETADLHELVLALKRDVLAFERDLDRTTREGGLHGHRRRYLKKRLEVLKARLRLPPTEWTT
jgi:hypothetical protein